MAVRHLRPYHFPSLTLSNFLFFTWIFKYDLSPILRNFGFVGWGNNFSSFVYVHFAHYINLGSSRFFVSLSCQHVSPRAYCPRDVFPTLEITPDFSNLNRWLFSLLLLPSRSFLIFCIGAITAEVHLFFPFLFSVLLLTRKAPRRGFSIFDHDSLSNLPLPYLFPPSFWYCSFGGLPFSIRTLCPDISLLFLPVE